MNYTLKLSRHLKKDLSKLDKTTRERIITRMLKLSSDPRGNAQKLKGRDFLKTRVDVMQELLDRSIEELAGGAVVWVTGENMKWDRVERQILERNGFVKRERIEKWECFPGTFVDDHCIYFKRFGRAQSPTDRTAYRRRAVHYAGLLHTFTVNARQTVKNVNDKNYFKLELTWPKVTQGIASDYEKMDPYKFELFIAKLFEAMGYRIDEDSVKIHSGDGGVDVLATCMTPEGAEQKAMIQCKRYGANNPVGREQVSLCWSDANRISARPVFVTTSRFTASAVQEANSRHPKVTLIDGEKLAELRSKYLSEGMPSSTEVTIHKVTNQKRMIRLAIAVLLVLLFVYISKDILIPLMLGPNDGLNMTFKLIVLVLLGSIGWWVYNPRSFEEFSNVASEVLSGPPQRSIKKGRKSTSSRSRHPDFSIPSFNLPDMSIPTLGFEEPRTRKKRGSKMKKSKKKASKRGPAIRNPVTGKVKGFRGSKTVAIRDPLTGKTIGRRKKDKFESMFD